MKTNLVFKTLPRTNCSSVRQWEAILGNLATAPLRHYLLATGQLKVMAMQLLCPSPGQFPRWFVKWLELVTRTSQVESWVKGGYLGRLAYQDNSTFQSFIRPFVDFSRNADVHNTAWEGDSVNLWHCRKFWPGGRGWALSSQLPTIYPHLLCRCCLLKQTWTLLVLQGWHEAQNYNTLKKERGKARFLSTTWQSGKKRNCAFVNSTAAR